VAALSVFSLIALVAAACAGNSGACTLSPAASAVARLCPVVPSAVAAAHDPLPERAHPSMTADAHTPFSTASAPVVPLASHVSRPGTAAPYDPLFGRLVI